MVRSQISIRLENNKATKLKSMAKTMGTNYTDLIRDKIDELLVNGVSQEIKERAIKITKELRGHFAYVKTKKGITRAQKEKKIREQIAQKIEGVFDLK